MVHFKQREQNKKRTEAPSLQKQLSTKTVLRSDVEGCRSLEKEANEVTFMLGIWGGSH